jgi:hypothetical protein
MDETNPNDKPAADKPVSKKATAGKTVTVYCKLPHGIRYALPDGSELRLVGVLGDERSPLQVSGMPGRDSVAGFGVTRNVDAEAWTWVKENHGDSAAHKAELIFARDSGDEKSGTAEAKEKSGETTGFEPIDPSKDPNNDKDANARNLAGAQAQGA